jgi:putative lipoprotein
MSVLWNRRMRLVVLAIVIAALSGCQSVSGPEHGTQGSTPATRTTEPTLVHGRAFYLERMMLPPGATLEVQLIDDALADAGATTATIASKSWSDLHGPPYEFALPYDSARIDASKHYSLRASLRDAQGHLEFATDSRVEVKPGTTTTVEFRLVRAAAQ